MGIRKGEDAGSSGRFKAEFGNETAGGDKREVGLESMITGLTQKQMQSRISSYTRVLF